MAPSPENIQKVFLKIAALSADERDAAIERECVDQPDLEVRIRELLAAHEGTDSLLDEAAPELEATHIAEVSAIEGQLIADRYTLRERIGEGGMGEVWVAKQTEPVKRRVALKLIKTGMDSRATLARFEQERQALAMMDHPNIAQVLDGGLTPAGKPFFVMELVNGLPLTKFCDDATLSLRQRLELFVTICQAVQHAHQKGIVHRDLKPSNILVTMIDGRPVPKIIDFGVAKAVGGNLTDETLTQFGAVVGTLEYMSPEQASFSGTDVDTRADIYSLGVILYELLTGLMPIDKARLKDAALNELIRIIREEEPSKPSTRLSTDASLPSVAALRQADPRKLTALLRGELDWVVMKCLEKDRDRRYETANALLRDLERYLVDEPVEARPPSTTYRMRKLLKRNKGPAITGGLLLVTLLAGIAGTSWYAYEARTNFRLAVAREQQEIGQRKRATAAEQLAKERLKNETAATRTAEAAVKESQRSLFELNTEIGLIAAEADRPAEALLWFAEAAENVQVGCNGDQACRIRHASWSESTPRLLNFIEPAGQPLGRIDSDSTKSKTGVFGLDIGRFLRRIEYDSTGKFLATLTESGQLTVWDVRRWARSVFTGANRVDYVWYPRHSRLITADGDGWVRVVEIPSGKVLHETESSEPVSKIAYEPQSEKVAICGKTIRLWDVASGTISNVSDMEDATIQSVSFSQDGSMVLASYDDNRARLFDAKSPTEKQLLPALRHNGTGLPGQPLVPPILVNRDRGVLTKSGNVAVWTDIRTGMLQTNISVNGNVTSMSSSPSGETFVVTSQGGQYQIWNALNAEPQGDGFTRGAWGACFTSDGLDMCVQAVDTIQRCRAVDGEPFGSSIVLPTRIHQFRASPDGRCIAIADQYGGVAIWEWGSYLPHYLQSKPSYALGVLTGRFRQHLLRIDRSRMKLSRSGNEVLVCGSNGLGGATRRVSLYSAADGTVVDTAESESLVLDACIAPDERTIAFANLAQEIYVWRRGDSGNRRLLATVDSEPLRIEFGPDKTTLIVLQIDGTISCVDSLSGVTIWQKTHPEVVLPDYTRRTDVNVYRRGPGYSHMQFQLYNLLPSEDGRFFVTHCANDVCCVWNSRDGSLKAPPIRIDKGNILRVALSPDGRWLAVSGLSTAEVYDTATGQRQQHFDLSSMSTSLHFDCTGRRLAICVESGECTIWDWQSRKQSCPSVRAHKRVVFFGENSQWLLAELGWGAQHKSQVAIWNTITGKPMTPSWRIGGASRLVYSTKRQTSFFPSYLLSTIQLDDLIAPADKSIEQRRREAEILSTHKIVQGKAVKLSASEWGQRIRSMHESNPDFFTSDWERESVITWHQDQLYRGLEAGNLHAARWHTEALDDLLGDGYKERFSHQAEVEFYTALERVRANQIDEAARHIRLIKQEHADLFGIHLGFNDLVSLRPKGMELIRPLSLAGYKTEAKQVCELVLRPLESRLGSNDGRVRTFKQLLAEDFEN